MCNVSFIYFYLVQIVPLVSSTENRTWVYIEYTQDESLIGSFNMRPSVLGVWFVFTDGALTDVNLQVDRRVQARLIPSVHSPIISTRS